MTRMTIQVPEALKIEHHETTLFIAAKSMK